MQNSSSKALEHWNRFLEHIKYAEELFARDDSMSVYDGATHLGKAWGHLQLFGETSVLPLDDQSQREYENGKRRAQGVQSLFSDMEKTLDRFANRHA